MVSTIPLKIKKECCRLKEQGVKPKNIYDQYYIKHVVSPCCYSTFHRALFKWEKQEFPDDTTLECGTYEGFTAHGATVQVSAKGEIVQAWIKQKANEFDLNDLVDALKGSVEPYNYTSKWNKDADRLLEIPLFDMHWGIMFLKDYEIALNEILDLIHSRHWDGIVIPFGQDFFHNDSVVNGVTTKGTAIEKVDMMRAIKEGRTFITTIIDAALSNSSG